MTSQPQVFNLFDGSASSAFGGSFGTPVSANVAAGAQAARKRQFSTAAPIPTDVFGGAASESSFSLQPAAAVAQPAHPPINGTTKPHNGASVPLAQDLFSGSPAQGQNAFFDRLLPTVQTPTKFPDTNGGLTHNVGNGSSQDTKTPARRPPTAVSAVSTPNSVTPVVAVATSGPKLPPQGTAKVNGVATAPKSAPKVAVPSAGLFFLCHLLYFLFPKLF